MRTVLGDGSLLAAHSRRARGCALCAATSQPDRGGQQVHPRDGRLEGRCYLTEGTSLSSRSTATRSRRSPGGRGLPPRPSPGLPGRVVALMRGQGQVPWRPGLPATFRHHARVRKGEEGRMPMSNGEALIVALVLIIVFRASRWPLTAQHSQAAETAPQTSGRGAHHRHNRQLAAAGIPDTADLFSKVPGAVRPGAAERRHHHREYSMPVRQAVVLETTPPRSSPTRPHGAIALLLYDRQPACTDGGTTTTERSRLLSAGQALVPGRAPRAEAISPTAWSKVADGRIWMPLPRGHRRLLR
jgi:hypothetical protein